MVDLLQHFYRAASNAHHPLLLFKISLGNLSGSILAWLITRVGEASASKVCAIYSKQQQAWKSKQTKPKELKIRATTAAISVFFVSVPLLLHRQITALGMQWVTHKLRRRAETPLWSNGSLKTYYSSPYESKSKGSQGQVISKCSFTYISIIIAMVGNHTFL